MNTKQKIYSDLEPHFIYDYIFFSANLRFLQSQENSHKKYKMDQTAKAMCLVNLFEIYQKSLEDLSAVILALYRRYNPAQKDCKYQKEFNTNETPVVYTLINYTWGEPKLKKILVPFKNDHEIINKFGINNISKININLLHPDINIQNVNNFFLVGLKSLSGDQEKRFSMFNKIKHGGIVVANGRYFSETLPKNMPAAIYADPKAYTEDDHPLTVHGFKFTEMEFELMQGGIMKIMVMIKILLSAYLCKEFGGVLKKDKGLKSPLEIFSKIEMKKYLLLWNGF